MQPEHDMITIMALSPKNIEQRHKAQTTAFVAELEKEIDSQLLNLFKPESKMTVSILVNPGKFSYKNVAEQLIALYSDTWEIDVLTTESGYNIHLCFTPK